jgi:hypothetical protein
MAYDYSDMLSRAQDWAKQAIAEGYLPTETAQVLLHIEQRSPEQLFATSALSQERPLIVAFMGGTGVGKSSLLNRLAGQAIARVGVERPTSREVTLFLHRSSAIQHLPPGLPLESIKISQHDDDENSHMVWIDMPDFDSVELSNKRLVLEWLPHIDVLIYVVSPERYRDNKAWQLLLAEGARHAWLFVMNQWDRGQVVQFEDFKRQLHAVGFTDPLMFRTSCSEPEGDDFAALLSQLAVLNDQHGVEQGHAAAGGGRAPDAGLWATARCRRSAARAVPASTSRAPRCAPRPGRSRQPGKGRAVRRWCTRGGGSRSPLIGNCFFGLEG